MIYMYQKDFNRLNFLSEKALSNKITPKELKEFNLLINDWNTSFELNLLGGLRSHKIEVEDFSSFKVGDTFSLSF